MTTARDRTRRSAAADVSKTVEVKSSGELLAQEQTAELGPQFSYSDPNPAKVRVGGSSTVNMGDYNSVRCEVVIEVPCDPNSEAIQFAYDETALMVEKMLQAELDAAMGIETPQ